MTHSSRLPIFWTSPAVVFFVLLGLFFSAMPSRGSERKTEGAAGSPSPEACWFPYCEAEALVGSTQWPSGVPLHFWVQAISQECGSGPLTYDWDFGDGSPHSSEQNPTHAYEYNNGNSRTWTVTVTAPGGATCTKSSFVTPMSPTSQVNNFVAVPSRGYSPLTVTFYPVGYEIQCPGTPYTWDFGDGTTSMEQNPTHTFTVTGTNWQYFDMHMTTWDYHSSSGDCGTNGNTSTVTVIPPCGFDRCETTVPATGRAGQAVGFNSLLVETCPGLPTMLWTFGDGATSSVEDATHTYGAAGTYTWEFRAGFPGFAAECVKSGQITIAGCTVTCTTTVPDFAPVGSPVAFRATVTTTDCTGISTYSWDFGDGTAPSTAPEPDYTYAQPGKYEWSLTVVNGTGKCEKRGTISVGCITMGSLSFCANSITQDGNHYTLYNGNININGLLWIHGTVFLEVDGPGASTGSFSTAGSISVRLASHEEELFQGPPTLDFDVEGDSGLLMPAMDTHLAMAATLAGMPLFAAGTPVAIGESAVTIKPILYVGLAGVFTLASMEATIVYPAGGKKTLAGVQIINGQITPSIQFMTIEATYNPDTDVFQGSVSIGFPFLDTWGLNAAIRVQAGCFNGFDITVGLPTGIPLGTTGFTIEGFTLKVDNICVPPQFTIFIGGDVGIAGVDDEVLVLSEIGLGYQQPYRLKIQAGTAKFLGYTMGSLGGALSAAEGQSGATLQGRVNLADIFEANLDAVLSIDRRFMGGSASGSLQIPNFTCHWVNVPCRVLRRAITSAISLPYTCQGVGMNLGISGRTGVWNGSFSGTTQVGGYSLAMVLDYRQGGDLSLSVGTNFQDLYEVTRGERVALGPEAAEQSVTLAASQPLVLFAAAGETAVPIAYLKNPQGQTITEANVGSFPGMAYIPGDEDTKAAIFRVENAAAGTWTVGTDNLSSTEVTFAALAPVPPPQASFSSVQQSGETVNISLAVTPPSSATTVGLFFASDAGTEAGVPIDTDLPATSGTVTTSWNTSGLASGTYYLFAAVNDGKNSAVVIHHPQALVVTRGDFAAPTGLTGTRAGAKANLAWTASSSLAAAGTNILYTDTPEIPGYKERVASTLPDHSAVEGLDTEKTYRFAVQAFDAQGNFSPESAPLTLEPAPAIPGDCDGSGTVSIGEVQKAINMFLGIEQAGAPVPPSCGVDCNGDGTISIGEVQKVINAFLGLTSSC